MSKTHNLLPALAVVLTAMLCFSACKAPKDIVYFQNVASDTTLQNSISKNFDLKIKPDDLLYVGVTSASPEQSALFNAPQIAIVGGGTTSGYLVDKKGDIQVYKLGDVNVRGLTRLELKEKLQRELQPYLKDPVVTVRFLNNKVTVLGEVNRPGIVPMTSDQMTLIEAIGQSGDLRATGRRDNILVIRQTETGKDFRRVSILDNSIFNSPYYYLQSEDIIYVEPNLKKLNNKTPQIISYVISGTSLIIYLISRFIK
jgi:polysaccharide export outer membrane protein